MNKKPKKDDKHYVNNAEFLEAMKHHIKEVKKSKKAKEPIPQVSEYIGECIVKIANKLANRPNFVNYPFREEMVCDGIENCLQYLNNFNPDKSSNHFAYFTQIIYYAFVRRIQKEKKQLYTKYKMISQSLIHDVADSEHLNNTKYGSEQSDLNMYEFLENYESSKKTKNDKTKSKNKTKTKTKVSSKKTKINNDDKISESIKPKKKKKLSFDDVYENYKHLPEQ